MNYVLIAFLAIWSALGVIFYLVNIDEIPTPWKKKVAALIGGPIVWAWLIFINFLYWFSMLDTVYVGLVKWLKKP